MKRFYLSFCLIAASLILFTKCKKDDNPVTEAVTTNYSPLTVGSTWTYNYTQSPNPTVPYTLTVVDKDTTISGKTYKVLSSSDGSGNKYLAKVDSNYYRFATYPIIGNFEELYLKDNRDVNSTWTNSVPFTYPGIPIPLTANLTYTVKEKGGSSTVNGTAYNDVIHIRLDVSLPSPFGNVGGGDFYYAKNIGLINSIISVQAAAGSFSSTTSLTSYTIK